MSDMLRPGATIGILGGGQLGRMMALAAAPLGLKVHVFCPDAESPAFDCCAARTVAPYEDEAALAAFAAAVDAVTYEFENVPASTADVISRLVPLRPGAKALATTQDRFAEKSFLTGLGLPVAPFAAIDSAPMLEAALAQIGTPAVLKTRRFGYDGKGQVKITDAAAAAAAMQAIAHAPAILEGFVPFSREISVIAARGLDGAFAAFDVCENGHKDHILDVTRVPARIAPPTERSAVDAARRIGDALDYVGVFTVEMFLVEDGGAERIVVNEIAPRVHNSGHWTIEGAQVSQFEQHLRAICGWPLGDARRRGAATMTNLIGADVEQWATLLAQPGAHLHLYGKADAKPGRKMGHVTRILAENEQ